MRQSHNTTKREITNLNYASVRNCSTHECETRIHLEYKYKLLNLLLWIAEAIQAPNLIARFDSFDFRKQDWSSYWVPAPHCDANADFQSQKRWINTQQLAAAAIACYYNSLLFFLHQFHEFGSAFPALPPRPPKKMANFRGRKLAKIKKNTPPIFERARKKASDSLQPERVPWAKMATVLFAKFRARASLTQ